MLTSPARRPELGISAETSELTWLPAWRLRELIGRRDVSPVEVTEHFLTRIEALDPFLHAFRMVNIAGARAQAAAAERAMLSGASLGPLHGVPIALKEYIAVEGMSWTDLLTGTQTIAQRDSIEAERLRAAGAIIVGTTVAGLVVREFGDTDRQPLNPWDTRRVCGDSSSGSAAALAAAMVPAALAADGLGSTRLPAAYCGLVGLNPTRGRIATADWSQMNPRLLSGVGPLARDSRDAATLLAALAGPDGRDLMCLPDDPPDYLGKLDAGVNGLRLAWTDDFGFASAYTGPDASRVIETVRRSAGRLVAAGADIRPTDIVFDDPSLACGVIMASDRALAIRSEPPRADVIRTREIRQAIWRAYRDVLHPNDFILSPTTQVIAPTRQAWATDWMIPGYMAAYTAYTATSNLLGWPAISVPAGFVDDMPVALQILGRPNSEPNMLRLAHAFLSLPPTG